MRSALVRGAGCTRLPEAPQARLLRIEAVYPGVPSINFIAASREVAQIFQPYGRLSTGFLARPHLWTLHVSDLYDVHEVMDFMLMMGGANIPRSLDGF